LQGRRGEVVTSDISGSGLLVQSTEILPVGERIELRMDWPTPLNGRYPLQLVVDGEVLAITTRGTVIGVTQYEYRAAKTRSARQG